MAYNIAGIDIHKRVIMVVVADVSVSFGTAASEREHLTAWLRGGGVQQIVMQSTGVYWIALFDVLEARGFKICLANARHRKNLPGRKSDVQESQWLLKLHTHGLLRNSGRSWPENGIRKSWQNRGTGGLKATEAEVARSLEGNWREDMLFELRQAVDTYDFIQKQMTECDQRLQALLAELPAREVETAAPATAAAAQPAKQKRSHGKRKNVPRFNLQAELERVCGDRTDDSGGTGHRFEPLAGPSPFRLVAGTEPQAYVDRGARAFENRRAQRELSTLQRQAAAHGFKLVNLQASA